ncbi:MAG: zf-TFIIB domain-containing protein [Armatimonadetes bacterium]|nr:zf-TFIIB domain-containing protein [Armatimonadota bacterium]MDW8153738.1 zf-TFIIB domain-containing protein [Armatimonadota bacterium]
MLCPVCQVELRIAERSGIEIDYCPKCRGVWLDRGELDKIIERSLGTSEISRYGEGPYPERYSEIHKHRRKRKSFLSELFDFD